MEGILVQEWENRAISSFKKHLLCEKAKCSTCERAFVASIRKSPSSRTIDFGMILAVEAGWHDVLEELVTVDSSAYEPFESQVTCRHPLRDYISSLLDIPPAGSSETRRGYANAALLYAIVSGKVDAVRILTKYMCLDIEDLLDQPLLHYVYLLDGYEVRKEILDLVLPKLEPSADNLCVAAKHGDLESTKYFVEHIQPEDRYLMSLAGFDAILGDQDEVAKWIIEALGVVDMQKDFSFLVNAAVRRENLGMIEFLSGHSPALSLQKFGDGTASKLWEFLQQVNRPELFRKFIPAHPEGYSSS